MDAHPQHSLLVIWLFFFVGQALSVLSHAKAAKVSTLNGIESYRQYFLIHGDQIAWRVFAQMCCFGVMAYLPPGFIDWVGQKTFAWMAELLRTPMNPPLAGIIGLTADMALDRILGMLHLTPEIKPLPPQPPQSPTGGTT